MNAAPSASSSSGAAHASPWMNVMVEFSRTNAYDQDKLSRRERYRCLRDNAQRHREELEAWIASEGLQSEVKDVGDALAFDLLFVTATPQAAAALKGAPGVVAVRPAGDLTGPGGGAALANVYAC
jgi:hypothetical protein